MATTTNTTNVLEQMKHLDTTNSEVTNQKNFLSQLEGMMSAVKKEAGALEAMKLKLKNMEDIKKQFHDVKIKLRNIEEEKLEYLKVIKELENTNQDIRNDMQKLNDFYYEERGKVSEIQQMNHNLEQELSGIKLEKDYFIKENSKIPELKSINNNLKTNINDLKKTSENEKIKLDKIIKEQNMKIINLEKVNEDTAKHIQNFTDLLLESKTKLQDKENSYIELEKELIIIKDMKSLVLDRLYMTSEDLKLQKICKYEIKTKSEEQISQLQSNLQQLRLVNKNQSDDITILHEDIKRIRTQLDQGSQAYTTQITTFTENVKELSEKNVELIKNYTNMKQLLSTKSHDYDKCNIELERYRKLYSELQIISNQKDMESISTMKAISLQHEEISYKYQNLSSQYESLQNQSKIEQKKHWDELKKVKDNEAQLLEEADKLTNELQEKTLQLHTVESEKNMQENNMRDEVSGASQLVQTLKYELEKRLDDLMNIRQERDSLVKDKEEHLSIIEEIKNELSKNETTFRKTLENDRLKMKQEMLTRTNRIRTLEAEKQELLNETQGLMSQLAENQKEVSSMINKQEELRISNATYNEQIDIMKAHQNELMKELKQMAINAEDVKIQAQKNESSLKDEINRIDNLLRESKKSANIQVMEMSQHLKALSDDFEKMQKYQIQLQDNEKRALEQVDKLKYDLNNNQTTFQDIHNQLQGEIGNSRRELNDQRGKMKIIVESKTRIEMEMITLRSELNRIEIENQKQLELNKNLESSQHALKEQVHTSQVTIDNLTDSCNKYKTITTDMEETLSRKNKAIDSLKEDLVQLERDGLIEIRRLRLQLNSAEQEINEIRPMIPILQKDAAESKANVLKLQTNTSGTVNGLLEEVRKAEDTLMKERKRLQCDIDNNQKTINELQLQVERTKQDLEDVTQKAKQDRSDKELKVLLLESDIERIRSTANNKDERIEELVEQRQKDRMNLLEFKEKLDTINSELLTTKTDLQHEQAHRKRLEARLRTLMSTPEYMNLNTMDNQSVMTEQDTERLNSFSNAAGNRDYQQQQQQQQQQQYRDISDAGLRPFSRGFNSNIPRAKLDTDNYDNNSSNNDNNSVQSAYTRVPQYSSSNNSTNTNYHNSNYGSNLPQMMINNNNNTNDVDVRNTKKFDYYNNEDPDLEYPSQQSLLSPKYNNNPNISYDMNNNSYDQHNTSYSANQSPVVDRVSAALAARAAAESSNIDRVAAVRAASDSKNALKIAQQQRNQSRQYVNSNLSVDSMNQNMYNNATNTIENNQNRLVQKNIQSENMNNTLCVQGDDISLSADESIRRTQMILNKKLGLSASTSSSNVLNNKSNSDIVNNGSRSTTKLTESIQHGHTLYPPSPSISNNNNNNHRNINNDLITDASTVIVVENDLEPPLLRPLSPPVARQINNNIDNNITHEDVADNLSDSSLDCNQSSKSNLLPSNYNNNSNIPINKKKKNIQNTKKNVMTVEIARNYDGLEEALQLPKISTNNNSIGMKSNRK